MDLNKSRIKSEEEFHNKRFAFDFDQVRPSFTASIYEVEKPIMDFMWKRIALKSHNARVLEFGCARGHNASKIIGFGGTSYMGLDIASEAINAASEIFGSKKVSFVHGNCEETTFQDEGYDLIFGFGVLHHLNNERAFNEIYRLLSKSGTAIFYEPLAYNPFIALFRFLTPTLRTPDEHPYVRSDIVSMAKLFPGVRVTHSALFSPFAFIFKGTSVYSNALVFFTGLDKLLFKIPGIRWLSWTCVIEISKSKCP